MSAGGQATRSRDIPAVRRVAIHDAAHLPNDYSTTPGGTLFSTTPGGTDVQNEEREGFRIICIYFYSLFAFFFFLNRQYTPITESLKKLYKLYLQNSVMHMCI